MTVQLGSAYGQIDIDTSGAETSVGDLNKALGEISGGMKKTGAVMSGAITAPLVGMAAASVSSAMSFNELLANVQSLGLSADRVEELRGSVQAMASDTGKSTSDLTGGLYQVISAFGDSADTVEILGINAKAAAAGLATTEQAIALTSAVTKGYGDTSAEAVQKASDLAFQVVQLGQTTFPELASSMGNVVPLASALGVSQEELAAQFATLTGVTGSASEVSTQLRATYQAILKPTADMGAAISSVATKLDQSGQLVENEFTQAWQNARASLQEVSKEVIDTKTAMAEMEAAGQTNTQAYKDLKSSLSELKDEQKEARKSYEDAGAALGQTVVQSVGYDQALQMIAATTSGNTNELGKMFGSVEALNAVIALSGPQAETYAEKYAAMTQAVGASQSAFDAQTQGVNSAGFELQQMRIQVELVAQQLGQALIPAFTAALAAAQPLITGITNLVTWFTSLDQSTQTTILAVTGVVAALGPLVGVLGFVVSGFTTLAPIIVTVGSGIGSLVGLVGALINPITLTIGLVAGIAAVLFDWGGANEKVAQTLENWGLQGVADGVRELHKWVENVSQAVSDFFSGETSFSEFFDAAIPDWISTLFAWTWPILGPVGWAIKLTEWAWPYLSEIKWIGDLMDWHWPSLSKPQWISDLLNFKWPGWPSRPGWLGGGGGQEATGTNFASGGMTLVGERGPEMIQLPRGSRVYDAQETKQMMAGSGGNITVNVNVASVNGGLDLEAMAYRIAGIIRRQQAYA